MYPDSYSTQYTPTSPLSPRLSVDHGLMSPQSPRIRAGHSKASSRPFRLDLTNYPGFAARAQTASPPSSAHSPAISLNRGMQPSSMESPRLMREKQKELIARAHLTSKLAASPMTIKPEAPRLDPLGSPKGPVTPLALETQEAVDYFSGGGAGRFSPSSSPSARSSRSSMSSGKEEHLKKMQHAIELYP